MRTQLRSRGLVLSATGMLTDDVADILGISPNAARRHVAGAMAELGAFSKLEAIVLAFRVGLIEFPAG